jgi:uncharacterized repeat protein (TIGR01451 family)
MKKYGLLLVCAIVFLLFAAVSPALADAGDGITITKTADLAEASPGDNITYTYVITNSDNVTVDNITLEDDKLGAISLSTTTLAPGDNVTATASHVVEEGDYPSPLENTATASGKYPNSDNVTASTSASVTLLPYAAALQLTKTADMTTAGIGDNITYTYTINNTGEVNIDNLVLIDDMLGGISLAATSLDAGNSTTATSSHVVTAGDLPGPIVNTANVTGTNPQAQPVSATSEEVLVALTYEAGLQLTKTADMTTAGIGDNITYTYTINNTSEVSISDLVLTDDMLGTIGLAVTSLDPGNSTTATSSHVVTVGDLPGPIVNTANVTGTDPLVQPISATSQKVSVALTYEAGLQLTKTPDVSSASPGEKIWYTYTVNNTSEVTINNLVLNDDLLGIIALNFTSLAPDESTTAIYTYNVTAADLPGPIVNTANVTGTDPLGEPVSATSETVSVSLTYEATLELVKTADKTTAAIGDNVTYTYTITNNGNVPVSGLNLEDDILGSIGLADTSLDPSDNTTATISYVVTASDLPGPIVNTANVTGTDSQGEPVSAASGEVSVSLTYVASLEVTKTANINPAAPHETITYTYSVNNNGDVAVSGLVLVDDRLGTISLANTSLDPGNSTNATATYEVTVADLPGPIVNTANVTGTDSQGELVSAVSSAVSVELIIKKELMTKAEILKLSGVPGKGIDTAPGLQKQFNPNSNAAENAGKKDKNEEENQEINQENNQEKNNNNNSSNNSNSNKNKDKNKNKNKD